MGLKKGFCDSIHLSLGRPLLVVLALLCALPAWAAEAEDDFLVPIQGLLERQADASQILIDARSPQQYHQGHIAGAINLPVDDTYDLERPARLAGVAVIKALFSEAGIKKDAHLVIYDDGSFQHAARLFWVFEVFGQPRVSLLNSGYEAWADAGLPTSTEATRLTPTDYVPVIRNERIATTLTTRLAIINAARTLIDSRIEAEYRGLESKTEKFGHIPSAVNYPSVLNLERGEQDAGIRRLEALQDIYNVLPREKPVIAYCNQGKESALTYFALRRLGFDVSTYDGSWIEWSAQDALPISRPDDSSHSKHL